MRHLTIRNVPPDLAQRLEQEKRTSGQSLNQTVLDLLARATGLERRRPSNGLAELAGRWSADEQMAFDRSIAETEQIDPELWR